MALVFMVQSRSLSCSHPTGAPAEFWEDPSPTGRCVPVSHPAAEGGFQRGMEMLRVGQRCCGLNYRGLGLWGTGEHPHWVMPWGWQWWRGRCHPPSLPPCGWIASSQLLLPEWLHRGIRSTREHGPDPEMSPVPAAATRHPCTCSWWPVCAAARTILPHFPCPGLSSRLRLSQGWIRSAARQSVGGERRSRLGNTKQ